VDPKRLLFASIHCYLAPSSGVARCTRELLEAPAARGADRRVFSAAALDSQHETSLAEVPAGCTSALYTTETSGPRPFAGERIKNR
jgi:hypothetical protein